MISKKGSLQAITLGIVMISFNVGISVAAPPSPPPPPSPSPYESSPLPSPYPLLPPPYESHPLIVRVVGKVYCYTCYDWNDPEKSHNKKPLIGGTVEVACKAEEKTIKAYGKTKSNGKYMIIFEDFDYSKYGPPLCEAKLYAPPKESSCNIPTNLSEGTDLKVKYEDKFDVVLEAEPFAYAHNKPFEECDKSPPPPPLYIYASIAPPIKP